MDRNPHPEASVEVGGIVFTFVSSAPGAHEIPIADPRPLPPPRCPHGHGNQVPGRDGWFTCPECSALYKPS